MTQPAFSVVVPCFNEREGIEATLEALGEHLSGAGPYELIVVDDGSTDGTGEVLDALAERGGAEAGTPRLRLLRHERNRGYGAALKTGVRRARGEVIVITDADGTYPQERIPDLVRALEDADMAVGARTGPNVRYPASRKLAKWFLARFVGWMAGRQVPDMNSGLRAFRKDVVARFLNILPDGFSFTTTITLAMLTNGYEVRYLPIDYAERVGSSKIRPIRDTLGFAQLILRTGMYFAPLRVLMPLVAVLLAAFLGALAYDVLVLDDITDKSILLLLFSMNTAMFALIADMIDKRLGR